MSDKDKERFWNFMIFNVYMTNEERDSVLPFVACSVILIIMCIGIYFLVR